LIFSNSPGIKWSHENASEMMLDYLIDDNHIDIDQYQINFIKDLIAGTPRSKRFGFNSGLQFFFECRDQY
jgi:hypothetical protein